MEKEKEKLKVIEGDFYREEAGDGCPDVLHNLKHSIERELMPKMLDRGGLRSFAIVCVSNDGCVSSAFDLTHGGDASISYGLQTVQFRILKGNQCIDEED